MSGPVGTTVLWVGVAICGGAGAVLRFVVDGAVVRRAVSALPVGTLTVNLTGAFVLGLVDGAVLSKEAALLVGAGLIGSYTTFSTWMLETQRLAEERRGGTALVNIGASMAAGLLVAWLGLRIGATW